jgi:hypothetical protein
VNTANVYGEVVWIIDRNRLVDAESYERTYGWDGVQELPSGYYVARWPAGTTNPHFLHDELNFSGPYGSRRAAEAALAAVHPERPELRLST